MRLWPALVVAVVLLLVGTAARAAEMQGASDSQRDLFLAGAAQGIAVTNTQSLIGGRATFCPPADYVLNASEMNRLADGALKGEHAPTLFVMAALEGLKQEFPC